MSLEKTLRLQVSPHSLNLITQALAQLRDHAHLMIQDIQGQVAQQMAPAVPLMPEVPPAPEVPDG